MAETDDREEPEYDICLSFAGEQRPYVERVASSLKNASVRVFYDRYEQVNLWGKDLYEHLSQVYRDRARYCVIFISKEYAAKQWTTHERKSAQARAFRENSVYILPARFDETELPGMNDTVGYMDLRSLTPDQFAALIVQKLEETPRKSSDGRVPRKGRSTAVAVEGDVGHDNRPPSVSILDLAATLNRETERRIRTGRESGSVVEELKPQIFAALRELAAAASTAGPSLGLETKFDDQWCKLSTTDARVVIQVEGGWISVTSLFREFKVNWLFIPWDHFVWVPTAYESWRTELSATNNQWQWVSFSGEAIPIDDLPKHLIEKLLTIHADVLAGKQLTRISLSSGSILYRK